MSQYRVLFEAKVLYPAPMRDALMQPADTDLFKAVDLHPILAPSRCVAILAISPKAPAPTGGNETGVVPG